MNYKIVLILKDNKKIKLKTKTLAIYDKNNYVLYNDNNYENKIDLKNKCFYRKDKETMFLLDFKNNKCQMNLIKNNKVFDIIVNQLEFNVLKNCIILNYNIESNDHDIEIKIKLKGKINEK